MPKFGWFIIEWGCLVQEISFSFLYRYIVIFSLFCSLEFVGYTYCWQLGKPYFQSEWIRNIPNSSDWFRLKIRFDCSDTDFGMIRNISNWFGMNSYPKRSPGKTHQKVRFLKEKPKFSARNVIIAPFERIPRVIGGKRNTYAGIGSNSRKNLTRTMDVFQRTVTCRGWQLSFSFFFLFLSSFKVRLFGRLVIHVYQYTLAKAKTNWKPARSSFVDAIFDSFLELAKQPAGEQATISLGATRSAWATICIFYLVPSSSSCFLLLLQLLFLFLILFLVTLPLHILTLQCTIPRI